MKVPAECHREEDPKGRHMDLGILGQRGCVSILPASVPSLPSPCLSVKLHPQAWSNRLLGGQTGSQGPF